MAEDSAKEPEVSVLVPIYNVERYLRTCLESLRMQTFRTLVICINDGSTDSSAPSSRSSLMLTLASGSSTRTTLWLRCLDEPGPAGARGRYVAILESDDFLSSTRLPGCTRPSVADSELCQGQLLVTLPEGASFSAPLTRGRLPVYLPRWMTLPLSSAPSSGRRFTGDPFWSGTAFGSRRPRGLVPGRWLRPRSGPARRAWLTRRLPFRLSPGHNEASRSTLQQGLLRHDEYESMNKFLDGLDLRW